MPASPRRSRLRASIVAGSVCFAVISVGTAHEPTRVLIPKDERPRLARQIRSVITTYDAVSAFPFPALDDQRLSALFDGDVVRLREKRTVPDEKGRTRERHRAFAFRLVRAAKVSVWLSALDAHFTLDDRVTGIRLDANEAGRSTWYQFMDLPWPVGNRHWVIGVMPGTTVSARTAGQVWEQSWRLAPGGEERVRQMTMSGQTGTLSRDDVRGATYLEANDGAWTVVSLGDDLTLVAYNLTIVLGGRIPDGLAARFAMGALKGLLDRVADNVTRVPSHYVDGHPPIYAGDGREIPRGILPMVAK